MAEPATDEEVEKWRKTATDGMYYPKAILARLDAEIAARRAAEARVAELTEAIKQRGFRGAGEEIAPREGTKCAE